MGTPALWVGFVVGVLALVAFDLVMVKVRGGGMSTASAVRWTLFYIALSLGFGGFMWWRGGTTVGVPWLTAYVIEYALSVDNLFVFLVIFSFFKVKKEFQHRLLYWGVLGAVAMRAALIGLGTTLVSRFSWILYFFGAFLLYTAWKLLFAGDDDEEVDPEKNIVLRVARKVLPVSSQEHGPKFFAKESTGLKVTPLFLVLLVVETSDVLFALDSIPAVLGISKDTFVVFTSNVAAVMGLRSLFFVVASLMDKFHYLKVGLGIILGFVGVKLCLETYFHDYVHEHEGVVVLVSLGFILTTLTLSVLASMKWPKAPKGENENVGEGAGHGSHAEKAH